MSNNHIAAKVGVVTCAGLGLVSHIDTLIRHPLPFLGTLGAGIGLIAVDNFTAGTSIADTDQDDVTNATVDTKAVPV